MRFLARPSVRHRLGTVLLGFALLAAGCAKRARRDGPPSVLPAWELAARQLVPDALRELPETSSFATEPARREAEFTRAVLLLNAQPKTQANVADAARRLEALREGKEKEDAIGRRAGFTLARIAQWHLAPPDLARAATLYGELTAGADPLAQAARVQLAGLRLFEQPTPRGDAGLRTRLQALEAEADALTDPAAMRDFHLLMADGYRELAARSADADLLRHLLAAESAGMRRRARLNLCAEVGELARRLGQNELAATHFRQFLAISSRDLRTALIRQRLQELDPTTPEPKS